MRSARRPLKLSDLEARATRFAVELQPGLLYASVDSLVQDRPVPRAVAAR